MSPRTDSTCMRVTWSSPRTRFSTEVASEFRLRGKTQAVWATSAHGSIRKNSTGYPSAAATAVSLFPDSSTEPRSTFDRNACEIPDLPLS